MPSSQDQKQKPNKNHPAQSPGHFIVPSSIKSEMDHSDPIDFKTGEWIYKVGRTSGNPQADLSDTSIQQAPKAPQGSQIQWVPREESRILLVREKGWKRLIPIMAISLPFVLGCSYGLFLTGIRISSGEDLVRNIGLFSFLVLIAALFGFVGYSFIRQLWLLLPSELRLAHYPLRLGENVAIQFHRPLRYPLRQPSRVTAALCCIQGYHTTTNEFIHHLVSYTELEPIQVEMGSRSLHAQWKLIIPADGIPSKSEKGQKICWNLTVCDHIPGIPPNWMNFPLAVISS